MMYRETHCTGSNFQKLYVELNKEYLRKMINLSSVFPLAETLKHYDKKDFQADLYTGLTVGVLLIPQGMAYAMLAGMPPIYGLYAGLIPPVIYALFGSSPHLSVGPVAISSILLLAGVSRLAEVGSEHYISLVITAGLLIGVLELGMSVFKMGFFVNFISYPVIAGFTSAASIIIIITQLDDILGIQIPRFTHAYDTLLYAIQNLPYTHLLTLLIFGVSTGAILLIKRLGRFLPSALIVMAVATLLCYVFQLDQYGVAIIGSVPAGLPKWVWPDLSMSTIISLMPTVFTLLTIGIVASMSMAKAIETKHEYYDVQPDKELLGLGMAKIVGSFFQALPTDGSFSRSSIVSDSGGRTVMSSVIAAALVAISLMFFTVLLHYLPLAVLSAVIVVAVVGLFEYRQAISLWRTHRSDFLMMLTTFVVTLSVGIMEGVACGVMLSISVMLYRSTHPSVVELGRIKDSTRYRNLDRHEGAIKRSDIAIVRFDEQLYFANASFFKDSIKQCVKRHDRKKLKHVILDSSNIHSIDSTGIRVLKEVEQDLAQQNITLHLSNVIGPVRDILYKSNLLNEPDKHHMSVHEAVQFILENPTVPEVDYSRGAMQTNVVDDKPSKKT